jgi:hypothetical protein
MKLDSIFVKLSLTFSFLLTGFTSPIPTQLNIYIVFQKNFFSGNK